MANYRIYENADINDQCDVLLSYINQMTLEYSNEARKNEKTLEKLGLTNLNNETEELIKQQIDRMQEIGINDTSSTSRSINPEVSDRIDETLNGKKQKACLTAMLSKEEQQILQLKLYKSLLERELESASLLHVSLQNDETTTNRKNSYDDYFEALKQLERNDKKQYTDEDRKKVRRYKEIWDLQQKMIHIKDEIKDKTKQLEKYGDLPPHVVLAKNMLVKLKQDCKEVELELEKCLQAARQ